MSLTFTDYVLPQIPYLSLTLAAYATGIGVAIHHLRKHRTPASFVLAGCGLLFLLTSAQPVMMYFLLFGPGGSRMAEPSQHLIRTSVFLAFNLGHAAGFVLLLIAAFVRRETESNT